MNSTGRTSNSFLLLSIGLLLVLPGCQGKKEQAKEKAPVPVMTAAAAVKDLPVELKAIGNVEPFSTVNVKSQVNGQILKVHFTEGLDVQKGDLLFTIDPAPFEAALKQARALLAKDRAQAGFATEQAKRFASLLKDGIVSQDQHDQLQANADALQGVIAADSAAVEHARLQLSYCSIRSPISGRTGNLAVHEGNLVKANDNPVLVTVNRITPVSVSFTVPEKELPLIRRFMASGSLKVVAQVPDDRADPEAGQLSFLDNSVDVSTGMIRMKATFANDTKRLWPGQFVDVVLTLTTRPKAVVVPQQAVQTGQQGQYVFVVKQDGTAEMRRVTAGISSAGLSEIENGLQPGEVVITEGHVRVLPGAKVQARQPTAPGASPPAQQSTSVPRPAKG